MNVRDFLNMTMGVSIGGLLTLVMCLSAVSAKAPINWETKISNPEIRDFREACYSSFADVEAEQKEQDRKIAGMQKAITRLFAEMGAVQKQLAK